MRTSTWIAVIALGVSVAALAAQEALAGKRTERFELVAPVRSPDQDARGVVRVKTTKRGAKTTVRMKKLTAGASYEVRDADSDRLLGTVTATRRGKAKLKVKPGRSAGKAAVAEGPDSVVVYRADEDQVVLIGDEDDTSRQSALADVAFGDGYYGTLRGPNATVSLFSDGDGHGQVSVFLDVRTDGPGKNRYEYVADTIGGGELPGGVSDVADLTDKEFAIVDDLGDEVVAGTFPRLQTFQDLLDGEWMFEALPAGSEADDVAYVEPFTLRMDLAGAGLEGVAVLERGSDEYADDAWDAQFAFEGFGRYDGVWGDISLIGDFVGGCITVSLNIPDEDYGILYHYSASNYAGESALPVGADSLEDLSGRALQIRDATGVVLVERIVPDYPGGFGDFWNDEVDGELIAPGTAPYSVWVADDAGAMTYAGDMTEYDFDPGSFPWTPEGSAFGGGFYGDYFGVNASLTLSSIGEGYQYFGFVLWIPDGTLFGGDVYQYTAEGAALPFGVERVADLGGRAFELRNADGDVVVADDLPEVREDGSGSGPGIFDEQDPLVPGPAPYTLWIADESGTLIEIASLEHLNAGGF